MPARAYRKRPDTNHAPTNASDHSPTENLFAQSLYAPAPGMMPMPSPGYSMPIPPPHLFNIDEAPAHLRPLLMAAMKARAHQQAASAPPLPAAPVIQPLLEQAADLARLQAQVAALEAGQKRRREESSSDDEPLPRIGEYSRYLNKHELLVRNMMRKQVKHEIYNVRREDLPEEQNPPPAGAVPHLHFDFTKNVDHAHNVHIVEHVTTLLYKDLKDPDTSLLPLPVVPFTRHDVLKMAKEIFREQKRSFVCTVDENKQIKCRKMHSLARRKGRQYTLKLLRRRGVTEEFEDQFCIDADVILHSEYMTEYYSQLDTDDEDKRKEYREKLQKVAKLSPEEIKCGVPVWEVVRPEWRSEVMSNMFKALDIIIQDISSRQWTKSVRPTNRRVELNDLHILKDAPLIPVYPFMLDEDWFKRLQEKESDDEVEIYERNPDGYDADEEQGHDGHAPIYEREPSPQI